MFSNKLIFGTLVIFLSSFLNPIQDKQRLITTQHHIAQSNDPFLMLPLVSLEREILFNNKALVIASSIQYANKDNSAVLFLPFTRTIQGVSLKEIPVLVVNFDSNKPVFYFDLNADHVFDVAEKVLFHESPSGLIFQLAIDLIEQRILQVQLVRSKVDKGSAQAKALYERLLNHPRYQQLQLIEDASLWSLIPRFRIMAARVPVQDSLHLVGLLDVNNNGIFNESGIDKFVVANRIGEFDFIADPGLSSAISDTLKIQLGSQVIGVKSIKEDGSQFIAEFSDLPIHTPVSVSNFPDTNLVSIQGVNVNTKTFFQKYSYSVVDFFGLWCRGCIAQMPQLLDFIKTNEGRIGLMSLNVGDSSTAITAYFRSKGYNYEDVFSVADSLLNRLSVIGFPTYMLVDRTGKIIFTASSVSALNNFILSNPATLSP